MSNIIPFDYNGTFIRFTDDGWLNATDAARQHGKEPTAWLRKIDTLEYIGALANALGIKCDALTEINEIRDLDTSSSVSRAKVLRLAKETGLVRTSSGIGGGTWLHPKLLVLFARWIDVDFAVWADLHLDTVLRGGGNALQQYERAHKALETAKEQASEDGRGLAQWRHKKEPLHRQVEYWRDQLQLSLPMEQKAA